MESSQSSSFYQLQSPLLDLEQAGSTMASNQELPLQQLISSSCGDNDDEEHDQPNDGIFRVIQQQQHQHNSNIHDMQNDDDDDDDDHFHVATPQPKWYQQPQQVSAMISNFSTSYNAVNVSLVLPILRVVHQQQEHNSHKNHIASSSSAASSSSFIADAEAIVASSLLAGMMIGQILGGIIGDIIGPNLALQFIMVLQIIASIGSSCSDLLVLLLLLPSSMTTTSTSSSSPSLTIYWYLAAWRFILGIGAGGVYPLAAVLSANSEPQQQQQHFNSMNHRHTPKRNLSNIECDISENPTSDESDKLHRVVLTFSTQGLGFITVPIVAVLLLHLLPNNMDVVWRLMLGFGCIPGIILLTLQCRSMQHRHNNDMQIIPSEENDRLNFNDTTDDELDCNGAKGSDNDGIENGVVQCSLPDSHLLNNDDVDGLDMTSPPGDLAEHRRIETKSWWESIRNEEKLVSKLLGTAATWFLFDVLFYGNTLFQPIVMEAAFGGTTTTENGGGDDPVHVLQRTARNSLILTSIALPGYIVASTVLGKSSIWCYCGIEQTPRFVMMQGFGMMAVLYFAIGSAYDTLRHYPSVLVLLYSLTFFFANFGPNTTTFVLPSLVFSDECRSTFNGLSAAAGKLGALMGATLFEPASNRLGNATVMLLCSTISVMALILTKYFVPVSTYHRSSINNNSNNNNNNTYRLNRTHARVPADTEVD